MCAKCSRACFRPAKEQVQNGHFFWNNSVFLHQFWFHLRSENKKTDQILKERIYNARIGNLEDIIRCLCAISNAFFQPLFSDSENKWMTGEISQHLSFFAMRQLSTHEYFPNRHSIPFWANISEISMLQMARTLNSELENPNSLKSAVLNRTKGWKKKNWTDLCKDMRQFCFTEPSNNLKVDKVSELDKFCERSLMDVWYGKNLNFLTQNFLSIFWNLITWTPC